MARDINRVTMIGRLTKDPDLKRTKTSEVATASLAVNDSYGSGDNKKESTTFIEINVWGKMAVVLAEYGKKGSQIAIDGKLKQNTWTTPEGEKKSKHIIIVESFQLLGGKIQANANTQSNTVDYQDNEYNNMEDIF